ncbi:MAG: cytochrome c-type biogenesis CcmF C-terminal domain-containing protein [Gemmatimonadales bacterium]
MNDLGELSLWIALLMSAWGAALSLTGAATDRPVFVTSGRRGVCAAAAFTALSAAALLWALWSNDFSLRYVASFTASNLPDPWRLSALWAGRAGSMLCWMLALSACATVLVSTDHRYRRDLAPWVTAATSGVLALFIAAALQFDPFARLAVPSPDGRGLDPTLQAWAAVLTPPLLYAGYMVTLVGILFAGVAVARRRLDRDTVASVRAWLAVAWCFMLGGALVGLRRQYLESGLLGGLDWTPSALAGAGSRFSVPGAIIVACATLVIGVLLDAVRVRMSGAEPGRGERGLRWRIGRATLAVGLALCLAGVSGAAFTRTITTAVRDGESFTAGDPFGRQWTFTSQGASRIQRENHFAAAVALIPARGGVRQPFVTSERRQYVDADERDQFPLMTTTGVLGAAAEDVAVVLTGVSAGRSEWRVAFIPLAAWIWIGGAAVLVGGACVLWPTLPPGEGV